MKHLLVVLAVISATQAFAQRVLVQGVGTFSCGKYLELRAEKNNFQDKVFVSWIWGYMAAFNMEVRQPTTRDLPDEASTLAYVEKHCRENPLDSVLIATIALIRDLGGRRNPR